MSSPLSLVKSLSSQMTMTITQLSVHKALTCPDGQSAWVLVPALFGEKKTRAVVLVFSIVVGAAFVLVMGFRRARCMFVCCENMAIKTGNSKSSSRRESKSSLVEQARQQPAWQGEWYGTSVNSDTS